MLRSGFDDDSYSMGIRQRVAAEFGSQPDKNGKLGRQVADDVVVQSKRRPEYKLDLSRSRFCGVFPGDGWSGRMEDSILNGCIPVIIQVLSHCQPRSTRRSPWFHFALAYNIRFSSSLSCCLTRITNQGSLFGGAAAGWYSSAVWECSRLWELHRTDSGRWHPQSHHHTQGMDWNSDACYFEDRLLRFMWSVNEVVRGFWTKNLS